jgi:histidine phosphotransferase ChpT
MTTPPDDIAEATLAALIGSRICHDLVSPLGAIGNGVELLMMSGAAAGPEIALIAESVTNANARIRFFRIAFGSAAAGQGVARTEIRSILDDMTRGGRLMIDWQVAGDPPRPAVKLAFLALQCLETALPFGGRVRVAATGDRWQITADSARLRDLPDLWSHLHDAPGPRPPALSAAQVQFALLPREAHHQHRRLSLDLGPTTVVIGF